MNIVYKRVSKLKSAVPLRDLKTKAHRWKSLLSLRSFHLTDCNARVLEKNQGRPRTSLAALLWRI